MYKNAVVTG